MTSTRDYPPHIARPSSSLIGPLIRFRGQPVAVPEAPPRDTMDPRYLTCTDHHLACHCREAELNENLREYAMERAELRELMTSLIDGHATHVYVDNERRPDLECRCGLCLFARRSHFFFRADNSRLITTACAKGYHA